MRSGQTKFGQSIRDKINLSLWMTGVVVVAFALLLLLTLFRLSAETTRTAEATLPTIQALETITVNVLKAQKDVLDFLFLEELTDEDDDEREEDEVAEVQESYEAVLNALDLLDTNMGADANGELRRLTIDIFEQAQALLVDTPDSDIENMNLMQQVDTLEDLEEVYLNITDTALSEHMDAVVASLVESSQTSQRVSLIAIAAALVTFIVLLLMARNLSHSIIIPLSSMKRAADAVGRGQFSVAEHRGLVDLVRVPNEFGVLARAFLRMTGDLESLYDDLHFNAHHDSLTQLPNRTHLLNYLKELLENSEDFAFIFLDFDHFKAVNDLYGHKIGDALLIEIGRRLTECLRPGDLVARLGGDEFTLVLKGIAHQAEAEKVAQRILNTVEQPCMIEGIDIEISASMGIALDHAPDVSAEDVLRDADIAMYHAKSEGRAQYKVFSSALGKEVTNLLEIEQELRQGLKRGELRAFYQPIVALDSEEIKGFEALVRWEHPERGLVSPGVFLPVAEACGLMADIDLFVLRQAAQQIATWNRQYGKQLSISVNLSGQHFGRSGLVTSVAAILEETGLEPERLNLEMTETVLVSQKQKNLEILKELRALGVHLHLDDFGTGYSSLAYLQTFPVDTLKIDRSFIAKILQDEKSARLVGSIIAMARVLGLAVVAEGIEEQAQLHELGRLGCEYVQGFYYAKPSQASEAEALLETRPISAL